MKYNIIITNLLLPLGYISKKSIPDALNPLLTLCSGIVRLSIHLKLSIVPSYFALDVFLSFNSRDTSATFPDLFTR